MFRTSFNGKEIIIRFSTHTKNMNVNKDYLYKKINSICDNIMDADYGTSFIVEDDEGRVAVGTVQHGEITVISIHHIVEHSHMFLKQSEAKRPS